MNMRSGLAAGPKREGADGGDENWKFVEELFGEASSEVFDLMSAVAEAEKSCVHRFCTEVKYPTYKQCLRILAGEMRLYAEYGEANHDLMKELYDSAFADEDLIRINGRIILKRGGSKALWANAYAINRIMVRLASTCDEKLLVADSVKDPAGGPEHPIMPQIVLCGVNKWFLEPVWEELVWTSAFIKFGQGPWCDDALDQTPSKAEAMLTLRHDQCKTAHMQNICATNVSYWFPKEAVSHAAASFLLHDTVTGSGAQCLKEKHARRLRSKLYIVESCLSLPVWLSSPVTFPSAT